MIFSFFDIWKNSLCLGFSFLQVDTYREDDLCFSLFGVCYDKEDKVIGIDIFYKYFEIKL